MVDQFIESVPKEYAIENKMIHIFFEKDVISKYMLRFFHLFKIQPEQFYDASRFFFHAPVQNTKHL